MTRKDYIAIGEAVAKVLGRMIAWEEREEAYPGSTNCMAITRAQLISDIGSQLLYELSHTFKADNARVRPSTLCRVLLREGRGSTSREGSVVLMIEMLKYNWFVTFMLATLYFLLWIITY
jgi:hypothetical protein